MQAEKVADIRGMEQVLEYCVNRLIEQGGQSVAGGDCVYRGTNGKACFIGMLVPEDSELVLHEGVSFGSQSQKTTDFVRDAYGLSRDEGEVLQSFHDEMYEHIEVNASEEEIREHFEWRMRRYRQAGF